MGLHRDHSQSDSFRYLTKSFDLLFNVNIGKESEKHQKKKRKRCRKRLSQLLHTHVALITVCVLSALDATCVLGQIICDILIMTEKQHANEVLQADASKLLKNLCPNELNHTSAEDGHTEHEMTLQEILEKLKDGTTCKAGSHDSSNTHHRNIGSQYNVNAYRSYGNIYAGTAHRDKRKRSNDIDEHSEHPGILHRRRQKRAAGGDAHGHADHDGVLYELTHAFHLGSMIILSLLLLETFLKIFSMGQKFLHHKLEVFDAFVVTVSWCLDVGFWEGLWHQPGTEAATILIVILPWRVIRIVNSFVLVIQEKDLVLLKLMKQQYRMLLKKGREMKSKLEIYRVENRRLLGLCRKHNATEEEIQACMEPNRKARRSSIVPAFSSFASLAMIGAVASVPDLKKDSSDEDDDSLTQQNGGPKANDIFRSISIDSGMSTVDFSLSPDPLDSAGLGSANTAFTYDEALPPYSDILTKQMEAGIHTKL